MGKWEQWDLLYKVATMIVLNTSFIMEHWNILRSKENSVLNPHNFRNYDIMVNFISSVFPRMAPPCHLSSNTGICWRLWNDQWCGNLMHSAYRTCLGNFGGIHICNNIKFTYWHMCGVNGATLFLFVLWWEDLVSAQVICLKSCSHWITWSHY